MHRHVFSAVYQGRNGAQRMIQIFLTRKRTGVSAERSLDVLAYKMKRVMKIMGANGLMKALSA